MGSRKRVKPNPSAEGSAASLPATVASQSSQYSSKSSQPRSSMTEDSTEVATPTTSKISKPNSNCSGDNLNQVHKTKSWYGSWPRIPKSAASTQVARESILGGTSKPKGTVDLSRFESKKASDGISINELPLSGSDPSKSHESMAAAADESSGPVAQTSEEVKKPEEIKRPEEVKKPEVKIDAKDANQEMAAASGEQEQGTGASPDQPTQTPTENPILAESTPQRPASGWFGWLGKPAYTEPVVKQPTSVSEPTAPEPAASATAEMKSPDVNPGPDNKEVQPEQPEQQEQQISEGIQAPSDHPVQGRSEPVSGSYWFWRWSSTSLSAPSQPTPQPEPEPRPAPDPSAVDPGASACPMKEPEDVAMKDAPAAEVPHKPSAPPPRAGSTWAFWSRDTSSASGKKPVQQGEHGEQGEQGQLAVMGESSETHPKRANSMEFNGPSVKEPPLKSGSKDGLGKAAPESSSKRSKRVRPQSMDIDDVTPSRPSTPKVETSAKSQAPKTPATAKTLPPNLLLPSFSGTYKLKENASILKQIAQLLLRTQQPSAKHVYLTKEPPKIKKAIAIGVHGLFPANYLRPMIGQPTGTSIKFAKHCAEAVRRWADAHGCEDCEIEKVALEGEGKIGERVENLWKLLLNWIDHIRHADLILIACHSQGVPVSIMLLAKLIELGVVTSAKVGVCAMAGVSLGPFPDYRSSMGILMGSAAELWEFADPQSDVSKRLEASTKAVLSYGARITYVGSIDDQLVPLESAIYAPAHHPYIYRAVFIDGRIHAPDFIAHLVGFALKLRNLGVSDHGLIRELSAPLAGSLYSGEGHSRLYDDEQVYDLAVTHALETTDIIGSVECEMHKRQGPGLSNPNPYHLPWIMRGLLEEDFVKTELSAETAELVRQFDDWKPVTKALKDVKYRLEAVRSKL